MADKDAPEKVSGNLLSINTFYKGTCKLVYKWMKVYYERGNSICLINKKVKKIFLSC